MKQIERLKLIDMLLRSKSIVNFEEFNKYLLDEEGITISERQFHRDIKELKNLIDVRYPEAGKELLTFDREKKVNSYKYQPGYSAFPEVNSKEIRSLVKMLTIIEDLKHMFIGTESQALYEKLKAMAIENNNKTRSKKIDWNPVSLVKEGTRSGQDNFDTILKHIRNREIITFTYQQLNNVPKKRSCLPVLLKEYNNGWYSGWYMLVLPINEEKKDYVLGTDFLNVYALDRILEFSTSTFKPKIDIPKDFNPDEYFDYIVGVTRRNLGKNASTKKYRIHIQNTETWIYEYIKRYPIHQTQQIIKDDKETQSIEFTIRMEKTNELMAFLFRYSAELKVIRPKGLQKEIAIRLRSAYEGYL